MSSSDLLSSFVAWLGRNSVQACVLVVLILAIQAVLRDRISPRWRYALWLILVVKLALPWGPPSRVSVYNLLPLPLHLAVAGQGAEPAEPINLEDAAPFAVPPSGGSSRQAQPGAAPAPSAGVPADTSWPAAAPGTSETAPAAAEPSWLDDAATPAADQPDPGQRPSTTAATALYRALPLVWLVGAIVLALVTLWQALRLGNIRRRRLVTDQATLDLLEDCKQQMGVAAYLAVVETPRVSAPALFGFLRPRLLLPPGAIQSLGPRKLRHVFLHELAHLKRHDILVSWVLALLQILHWFNPLVWYAFARMRNERELACDALALSHRAAPDPQEYGRTIVDMLETFIQPRRQPSLAGVLEDKSQLKRRITMIAKFRKNAYAAWSLPAAAVLVVLSAVALTSAQPKAPAAAPPVPTEELVRVARQAVTDMAQGDFAGATTHFDATMKAALPPKDLQAAWDKVVQEAGPFQKQLGVRAEQFGAYRFIFVTCQFQQGPVDTKVVFDRGGQVTGLFFQPAQIALNEPASSQPSSVSFTDQDLKIEPYKEGNLFTVRVKLHNRGSKTSPRYALRYYRGEPVEPAGAGYTTNIDPIPPGGLSDSGSMPFALAEGRNVVTALLSPVDAPGMPSQSVAVVVTIKDGKIVSQQPSPAPQSELTPSIPDNVALVKVVCVNAATGKPVEKVSVSFTPSGGSREEPDRTTERAVTNTNGVATFQLRAGPYSVQMDSRFFVSNRSFTARGGRDQILRVACPANGEPDQIGRLSFDMQPKLDMPKPYFLLGVELSSPIPDILESTAQWGSWGQCPILSLQELVLGIEAGLHEHVDIRSETIGNAGPSMALPSGRFTVKTLRLYSADAGARKSLDAGVKGPGFIRFQEVDVYKFKKGEEPALQILPGEATRLAIDLPPEFLAKIKTEGAALADKAQKFFDEKDYEQALALFQQVIDKYPHWSGAQNAQMMIGLCYGHLNQHDKDVAAFERAIRDYPQADLAATYFYLGAAYEDAKRMDDALAAYRQSLQRAERIGRADAFPGKDARKRIEALEAASRGVMTAGQPGAAASQPSAAPASDQVRRALRTQFEVRQRRDLQKYTRQQLSEAEQLYQVANKNWRSPEARESLDQMIAKYPDINRTGCAVLYMAQWARGDERIQLLQRAIEKHGDCMYGDGVQVGAYARFYLAEIYDEAGQKDKARALYDEIRKLFPLAVNHRGIPLAQLIEASHPQTQPAEAAK